MTFWTGHLRAMGEPVLVREGFAWGALFFGPIWLALHRAWVPAMLWLAAAILIVVLAPAGWTAALLLAVVLRSGLSGHDLRRWSMRLRVYTLCQVIAARDSTEALARLLKREPDLVGRMLPPGVAR